MEDKNWTFRSLVWVFLKVTRLIIRKGGGPAWLKGQVEMIWLDEGTKAAVRNTQRTQEKG